MQSATDANLSIRNAYAMLEKVGEGTFASVFRAKHVATGRKVAVKKIKVVSSADGMDMSAIREVKFLRELKHPNVIEMLDVFSSGNSAPSLNLVLEFLDTDLEVLIKDRPLVFTAADIKSWMGMMLRGLEYCHRSYVLHRDLKPNNLLIAPTGDLKIADFGLAREFGDAGDRMTNQVITRWYRPPELLLGARAYSAAVDLWSVGTIFAELMLRTPYLPGESDIEQLTTIFRALGTPTELEWPHYKSLPDYVEVETFPRVPLNHLFSAASTDSLDLLSKLLTYDPHRRITAHGALHHAYFRTAPRPTPAQLLPRRQTKDGGAAHALLSDSEVKDEARSAKRKRAGDAGPGKALGTDNKNNGYGRPHADEAESLKRSRLEGVDRMAKTSWKLGE